MRPFFGRVVLNDAGAAPGVGAAAAAEGLQRAMLGAVGRFTRPDGRLDYRALRGSREWAEAAARAGALPAVSLGDLTGRRLRLAFWINVYNALVFHGIVALGIRRTVREMRGFYGRVCYRVGGFVLSADDIEHGILRGNAVPPHRLRRRLRGDDPRKRCSVRQVDPRIHFALVCASRTCPPIEAYEADRIDEQLDAAARTFINATSRLDGDRLHVSEIFRWYRKDFGTAPDAVMHTVARHLYDRDAAALIEVNAQRMRLAYTPYDWRLNR